MGKLVEGLAAGLGTENLLEEGSGERAARSSSRMRGPARRSLAMLTAVVTLLVGSGIALAAGSPITWSGPNQVDHQYPYATPFGFVSMSCPSAGLCVGNTGYGGTELISSTNPGGSSTGDWSVLSTSLIAQDGTGYSLSGTACVTTGSGPFCLATGMNPKLRTGTTGVLLKSTAPTGGASAWSATSFALSPGPPSCSQTSTTTTCIFSDYSSSNTGLVYVSTNPGADASSWTAIENAATANGVTGAACPSSALCAAVDNGGNFTASTTPTTASSWTTGSSTGQGYASSLSCPNASFCITDGQSSGGTPSTEIATTTNPGSATPTWTTTTESALDPYAGIRCSPDGALTSAPHAICFAQGSPGGLEVSIDGGSTWSAESLAAGTGSLASGVGGPDISCPANTLCVAGDSLGSVIHSGDASSGATATWSAPITDVAGGVSTLDTSPQACISTSLCVGSDGAGRILTSTNPADPSSWSAAMRDPGERIGSVACPSATLCVAVDSGGNVLDSIDPAGGGTTWTAPGKIDTNSSSLFALSCPSSGLCVTSGGNDVLISTNPAGGPTSWHQQTVGNGFVRLQCPSTALCVGVDGSIPANVSVSNNPTAFAGAGATWSTPAPILNSGFVNGLDCPTASLCVATDNNGDLLTSTNPAAGASSWSFTQIDMSGLSGVRCPSRSLCFAWDSAGRLLMSGNPAGGAGTWSAPGALDPGNAITGVECASSSLCAAIDNAGNAFTTTNPAGGIGSWSAATALEPGITLAHLACPSTTLCVVTDTGGNVFAGAISGAPPPPPPPPPSNPPSNSSLPAASGNATNGQSVNVTSGGWSGTLPISYLYRWQRCTNTCVDIAGAGAAGYQLTPADVGATVQAIVTAANIAGSASATSNRVGPVQPNPGQITTLLAAILAPSGKGAKIGALLKAGGFTFKFNAPGPGTVAISWYQVPKGAHLARRLRPVLVASVTATIAAAGPIKLKLKLTRAGRHLLKSAHTLKLTSKVRYVPAGGAAQAKRKAFKLRR